VERVVDAKHIHAARRASNPNNPNNPNATGRASARVRRSRTRVKDDGGGGVGGLDVTGRI
jgi:hypothetical protein